MQILMLQMYEPYLRWNLSRKEKKIVNLRMKLSKVNNK